MKPQVVSRVPRLLALLVVAVCLLWTVPARSQRLAVKTNLLSDVLLVPSLGGEAVLNGYWSFSLAGSYNPVRLQSSHYWRTYHVQPELRYWFVEPLAGTFLGVCYQWRGFDLGGLPFSHLRDSRSRGRMQGCGLTVGYHHILSTRWSLEGTLTAGYSHLHYDHYPSADSREVASTHRSDYFGPLDVGLSLVYILK